MSTCSSLVLFCGQAEKSALKPVFLSGPGQSTGNGDDGNALAGRERRGIGRAHDKAICLGQHVQHRAVLPGEGGDHQLAVTVVRQRAAQVILAFVVFRQGFGQTGGVSAPFRQGFAAAASIVLFFLVLVLGMSANRFVQWRERRYLG